MRTLRLLERAAVTLRLVTDNHAVKPEHRPVHRVSAFPGLTPEQKRARLRVMQDNARIIAETRWAKRNGGTAA